MILLKSIYEIFKQVFHIHKWDYYHVPHGRLNVPILHRKCTKCNRTIFRTKAPGCNGIDYNEWISGSLEQDEKQNT